MKNKFYLVGFALLILGGCLGWFLKSSAKLVETADNIHDEEYVMSDNTSEIWTCSMHPQIRQNEPSICPICEMDLIELDDSLDNSDPKKLRMSKNSVKLAQIETFKVGESLVDENIESGHSAATFTVQVDGTVEMDERTIKTQTVHVKGRIEEMVVTFEGQYINKGQKIATIFSTELLAASQELITAADYDKHVDGLKEAAVQKLKNWKISDSQIQEILFSRKPIETIAIYADHSGYVLSKKAAQGDYLGQGQAMYTIGSTSNVWLIFNVFESDLGQIKKGDKIKFTTPAVPNRVFDAVVDYIDPLLNTASRTATIRSNMRNSNNILKPGMLLQGSINTTKAKNRSNEIKDSTIDITIPNSALLWTGKRSVVYVQLPDLEVPTYEFREVEIGQRNSNFTTILSGLANGEEVVSNGAFSVDAAAQLNNNFSMINRDVKINNDENADSVPDFTIETSKEFRILLDQAIVAYLELKNAFVATDFDAVSKSVSVLLNELDQIDMRLLEGESHVYWMEQSSALKSHAENIAQASGIESRRKQFDFLSTAMINSIKSFGTIDKTYYVQYCPMANDNHGADWISADESIRNPYFGDKMMKCGSVKLKIN